MSKKTIIKRLFLSSCCFALAAWLTTAFRVLGQSARESSASDTAEAQGKDAEPWWRPSSEPRLSFSPVVNFTDHTVVPATGTILVRNRDNAGSPRITTRPV